MPGRLLPDGHGIQPVDDLNVEHRLRRGCGPPSTYGCVHAIDRGFVEGAYGGALLDRRPRFEGAEQSDGPARLLLLPDFRPVVKHFHSIGDECASGLDPLVLGVDQPVEVGPPKWLVLTLVIPERGGEQGIRLLLGGSVALFRHFCQEPLDLLEDFVDRRGLGVFLAGP